MTNLFQQGNFRLRSGIQSNYKIDCDWLTTPDWITLARMAADILPPFSGVEGVPNGGIELAHHLRRYAKASVTPGTLLICDDVLTTGGAMEEVRNGRDAIGVVAFARGPCPDWVRAVCLVGEEAQRLRAECEQLKLLLAVHRQ